MAVTSYLIGLGANRRHGRHGAPRAVLAAAVCAMAEAGLTVRAVAPVIETRPVGPGTRRFANGAAVVETVLDPPALLRLLKQLEQRFGRRRGRRWGDRALDLDILLWSCGPWHARTLAIPHPRLAGRLFALLPAAAVAPGWRLPGTPLALRHLLARARARR